jgi:arylsulfatase A-like enzyme
MRCLLPARFGLLILGAASLAVAAFGAAPSRPNVLIVLTDDQGMGDFSCYGNPTLRTPHLDRLQAQSVRFADFHVAPMCTPTRGQLISGQDAVRNGATSVTGGRAFSRPGTPSLAAIFASAGYRTGLFGKWHLGDSHPHRPMDRGFQEAVYHLGWGITSAPEFTNSLSDGRYFHNGEAKRFSGYCTDFWFERAMAWMKARRDSGEPFLCYLPTNAPHAPHDVPEKYSAPYRPARWANFFGMIANLDENMGRLETFLRETGLRENTIVVFMTDNGGTAGVPHWNAGLRDRKTTFYDGGHRVPCWFNWPAGGFGAPREVATPTQVQDILPTLAELARVPLPDGVRFDGTSLAALLQGRAETLPDRKFVVQYSRAKLTKWESAVVWRSWRLVHGQELYDVAADRGQKNDLAAARPEIVAELRAHYERWWRELEPLSTQFVRLNLGAAAQPHVALTSSDWQDVYADNAGQVRRAEGGPRGGPWNVSIERAGEYEFTLRRWPPELARALNSGDPQGGKALPIAGARLAIAGRELAAQAVPGERAVVLRTRLAAGPTQLRAWFVDAAGQDLCGAFYTDVRRLEP